MLSGIIVVWFILTALSVSFVAIDIRSTPESPVLKWAFVLITAYTGPFGAFLYVLGCREPLPGLHERYVRIRWCQCLVPPCIALQETAWEFSPGLRSGPSFVCRRQRTLRWNTFSGSVLDGRSFRHCSCATWRFVPPCPPHDVHSGISFDECPDGRHAAGDDHHDGQYRGK